MKRNWMWLLAVVPLFAGFVFVTFMVDERSQTTGERLQVADKRSPLILKHPKLVTRGLDFSDLVISPTGEKAVVRGNFGSDGDWSRIVNLNDGSKISAPGSVLARNIFSPDGKRICQLDVEMEKPTSDEFNDVLVLSDASTGKTEKKFHFAPGANLYGFWWQGGEITVESPRQTWRFEARELRLVSTQTRRRKHNANLCPDGKTLYWERTTDKTGVAPVTWSFADVNTEKILWSDTPITEAGGPTGFSVDGRVVLWKDVQAPNDIIARDIRTGAEKWRFRGPKSSVVALAPDNSALYEVRENGELWKWPR